MPAAPTVLVVEDEPEVRALLCTLLADAGWQPQGVATVAAALTRLTAAPLRALVLDLGLPDAGLPGLRALTQLAQQRGTVVVACSALLDGAWLARQLGVDRYVAKPVILDALLAALPARPRDAVRGAEDAVSEHILVVDDDPGIRQVVTLALQEAAYRVQEAANGEDALAQIAADPPALVLLDLQMPVMSGWQLLAQLSDHGLQVPVVVMTAGQRARTEAARLGAAGYLAKPFDLATLATVVATTARPRSTDPGD